MEHTCEVRLAAGLRRRGREERCARLAAPEAQERFRLLREHRAGTPARRVTALLEASVTAIGEAGAPSADELRALTVGDRDRLVLALHGALSGDELPCVFPCGCGETLELEMSVGALLGAADGGGAQERTESAPSGATVHVRAATGADHERAAAIAVADPAAAAAGLIDGCVLEARNPDGLPCKLDDELRDLAARLLAELDPAADIELRGACPACGETVTALLDPGGYVWRELERWGAQAQLEVHLLAGAYHWSEAEILGMDPERRARYIELVGTVGVA
jgi:hypothetical protein